MQPPSSGIAEVAVGYWYASRGVACPRPFFSRKNERHLILFTIIAFFRLQSVLLVLQITSLWYRGYCHSIMQVAANDMILYVWSDGSKGT